MDKSLRFDDSDRGGLTTMTMQQWVDAEGRGFLCSEDY